MADMNDKITRVMDMSERLDPCCQRVMLKMAGGWVADVEGLQQRLTVALETSRLLAAAINTLDEETRAQLWTLIKLKAKEHNDE